jgi:hypothetical protein
VTAVGRRADVICARILDVDGKVVSDSLRLHDVPAVFTASRRDAALIADAKYVLERGYCQIPIAPPDAPNSADVGQPVSVRFVRYRQHTDSAERGRD